MKKKHTNLRCYYDRMRVYPRLSPIIAMFLKSSCAYKVFGLLAVKTQSFSMHDTVFDSIESTFPVCTLILN